MSQQPEDDMEATKVASLVDLQQEMANRSPRNRAYVTVLTGSNKGEMHRVEDGETFIGRGQSATIRLNDDGISRRHARLLQQDNAVILEDLKSSNGTTVNGNPVTDSPCQLQDGDKIRLGSTTVLKFTYNDQIDESFQQQMYDAALRDGLTKAYNRTYFLDRLATEIAYARRHAASLSLLMFDVDHFKRINDNFGHLAGDYVLAKLGKIALATVRVEDIFARYGGEEFAVLCRGVNLASAGTLGERLRQIVEQTSFDNDGVRMPVTISVGVAAYPELQLETANQLIASADEALYEAKRTGRNRVLLKYGT